ncbi:MAG: ATP-binding protein [Polyangiaceae bacterium]
MNLGIRSKLFLISLGLILLSAAVGYAYVQRRVDGALTREIQQVLTARASLVGLHVETAPETAISQAGVRELARLASARVTIIATNGTVQADSEVSAERLPDVDNHGERPEVVAALAQGRGAHTRRSDTIGKRMTYVAVPYRRGGQVAGVVRVAVPLTQVDDAVARVRAIFVAAALFALAVAVVLSSAAAHWASARARSLTQTATRMAGGDLSVRSGVTGSDEFASLGRALDKLASNLSAMVDELERQHASTSGILDGMHEGVLLLGPDGRVRLVNPALREMLLLGRDALGKLPLEVIRHAELNELLERVQAGDEGDSAEIEVGGLKPRRLLVRASRFSSGSGGIFAVFVDVTEMRRLESLRSDFVANVSHELRTPVATVRSAAETLGTAMAQDPQAALRFVAIIERNAARLQELVEDLLDLSRIESRQYQMTLERLSLVSMGKRVVELFQDRIRERAVEVSVSVEESAETVRADRRALEHVLGNLLDNAIKYAGQGAKVRFVAKPVDAGVELSVEDTGPGIPAAHLPRLFERFYRVDAGRSRELGGTGLGLAIVKHLVEAMGGTVRVESEVGKGTRFWFVLPKGDQSSASDLSKPSGSATGSVGRPSSTTS